MPNDFDEVEKEAYLWTGNVDLASRMHDDISSALALVDAGKPEAGVLDLLKSMRLYYALGAKHQAMNVAKIDALKSSEQTSLGFDPPQKDR